MRDEDVVAAARAISAELSGSLAGKPSPSAAALDALLLRADAGEQVADEIFKLLASESHTRDALRRRLPQEEDTTRSDQSASFSGLPGFGEPSTEIVYRCTACEYEYPLFEVGEPVPSECPDRHGPLVLGE